MKRGGEFQDPIVLTIYCKTCTDARARRQHRIGYVTRYGIHWWHYESPARPRRDVEAYALNFVPGQEPETLNAWCPVHGAGKVSTVALLNALKGLKRVPANLVLPYVA